MIEKVRHKRLALTVLAAAQFIVILDATIVNVALPAIQKALGFKTDSELQWTVTAYALVFGGFLLLGGRLADLFGRRKVFLAGLSLFALASLLGGFAQSPAMLIIFRALQGLGGALLAPAALSLVLTIFKEGRERNQALGVWSMIAGGGGAIGLLLGGILTQYVNWRWVFFINVPIAVGVMIAALKYVPKSLPQAKQTVDIIGAVSVTGGLMSLVYALAQAPEKGWISGDTLGMFLLSAVLLVVFVVNEARRSHPLIKLSIFKRRNVTGGSLIRLFVPAALFGMFFYLSIYLQQILHYSPTMTGVAEVPFTLVLIAVSGVLSKNIEKFNAKMLLAVAPLVIGLGLVFFARVPVHANYWIDILPGIVLMSIGIAVVFVIGTVVTTSGVSHKESGLVSGILNTAQQIGGALGLAVLAVVSTTATKDQLVAAHGNPAAIPDALVYGFQRGFMVAIIFTILASLVAVTVLKIHRPTKTDLEREAENEAESLAAVPGA